MLRSLAGCAVTLSRSLRPYDWNSNESIIDNKFLFLFHQNDARTACEHLFYNVIHILIASARRDPILNTKWERNSRMNLNIDILRGCLRKFQSPMTQYVNQHFGSKPLASDFTRPIDNAADNRIPSFDGNFHFIFHSPVWFIMRAEFSIESYCWASCRAELNEFRMRCIKVLVSLN